MNQRENGALQQIAKHVIVLNEEVGVLQNDIKWIKKLLFVIVGVVSVAAGKVIFFG